MLANLLNKQTSFSKNKVQYLKGKITETVKFTRKYLLQKNSKKLQSISQVDFRGPSSSPPVKYFLGNQG